MMHTPAPRFPELKREDLNAAQTEAGEQLLKQTVAGFAGPSGVLLRSPELLKRYLAMTEYLRFETSLPLHLKEMAILMQARLLDSQFEWWAHEATARREGLSDYVIAHLKQGLRPPEMTVAESAVYDVVQELSRTRRLADATFENAKHLLGEKPLVDLVATTGFYVMVAMVLAAAELPLPAGVENPLPPLLKHRGQGAATSRW